ncbi:serine hydrolase domain-containing protein [Cytobacillus horneckiae]|uniref:serine hydrolase domain-containing protein n=1 Tax=Cytobacillus horneckiae TaxID=549687 RepID=UPI003D9A9641
MKNWIDNHFSTFNGSIFLAKGNDVLVNKGYGFADKEKKSENSSETRFMIASISKIFTATAIIQLYDKGMLNIDEPVNNYLDINSLEEDIKIIHLLNHTSGLKNFVMCRKAFNLNEENKPINIAKKICDMKRNFKAGEKFAYNNTGYLMLALIVEKVSQVKYEDFIMQNIFLPLKMNNSSFVSIINDDYAKGHKNGKKTPLFQATAFFGSGDILSTTGDLHKFIVGLNDGKLINKPLIEEMQKIHAQNTILKYGYGFGFIITDKLGETSVGHSGSIPGGYATQLCFYPKSDLVIIVLCNDIKNVKRFIPGMLTAQYIERSMYERITGEKISTMQKIMP